MKRYQPLFLACLFAMPLSALAIDTDKDGVADAADPAPNNILVTGYQPPWLHTFSGDYGDRLGRSVSNAGDVNNDGNDDVIVGAPYADWDSGSARVLSGATGAILYTFNGDSASDQFGNSVSGAGDVNNDGYDDVIIGASYDNKHAGSARVFSGANGSILYTFNGDSVDDFFGQSVSSAGDVNNDGVADVIVGAFQDDNNGTDSGSARVFSGANGSILYTFKGDSAYDYFGWSVSGAGDVNADGYDDLIVGADQDDNNGYQSGSARVLSGVNGAILYTFNGDSAGDLFGWSVSDTGDVNHDGYDDVIVGAIQDDNYGTNSGSARVFSGANGSILYTFNGANNWFGYSVSGAGDVNADGYADVIVGANSGSTRVFSGALLLQQTTDTDADGLVDTLDTNDDADSLLDVSDAFPQDTDNDGIPNSIDQDGDNDGVLNNIDPDDDNDGVPDAFDATPLGQQMLLNGIYKGSTINDQQSLQ